MFLAAIAMILVADGDLALDAPIGPRLDELAPFPDSPVSRLTLRQLLSHTSGLPASLDDTRESAPSVRRYLSDLASEVSLVCQPGSGFSYSNLGYLLTARLIEATIGLSWYEAVETLLLQPLGIEPAFVIAPGPGRARSATVTGHAVNAETGQPRAIAQTVTPAIAPAGALAMSAAELVGFAQVHLHAQPDEPAPLDPDSAADMHRPLPGAVPFGLADGWGLGMAVFRDKQTRTTWVGHDGTADGTSCHLRIDPAGGRVVALTSNADTGVELWHDLVGELRELGFPVASYTTPTNMNHPVPLKHAIFGKYVNGDTEYKVSVREDGRPYVAVAGEVYPDLTLYERGEFSVRHPGSGKPIPGGRFLSIPGTDRVTALQTGGRIARRLESA